MLPGSINQYWEYDGYGRNYEIRTLLGEKQVLKTTLYHEVPGTNYVSTRVISWKNETGASGTRQFDYAYDSSGNIIMMRTGGKSTMYQYNGFQQLTREDNQAAGKTWEYTYDAGGNILTKTEYAYTTGTPGTAQKTITYKYGDSQWRDLLTEYNGKTVTSDAIGNIKNDGTWDYSWEHGRQLASQTKSGTRIAYSYDANGMRLKKTVNGTDFNYAYNGNLLTHMSSSSEYAHIRYDAQGLPVHIQYKKGSSTPEEYYYMFNAQGDVVALVDGAGKVVVEYSYDAWGQPLTITGSMMDTLGKANPLRYRCYVYDEETGLYYLGSRYYNPLMGRFINSDDIERLGMDQSMLAYNVFAYCINNPIDRFDVNGNWSLPNWAKVAIGVVAVVGLAVATACTAGTAAVMCGAALSGAVTGGTSGAIIGAVSGAITDG
ncbi:RHS repeat-associated core domain-containing protein [Hominifimenecus microfluidus]|uniref:RHS repeat domain-containing protein n=1 Tax=Hominifimenecus microfluidus TaxID=2885348 RepID=UPI00305D2149